MGSDRVPKSKLARGSKIGAVAAGQMLRAGRTRMSMLGRSEEARARLSEESTMRAAEQLVTTLASMRGVAMKIGQMMSILDIDLVPEDHRALFQAKLAALQDSAPRFEFSAMRRVLEDDYGQPLEQVFAEFDPRAFAAASIGQVYRARLHDGRDVAVKVQYPGIEAAVRSDLKLLTMFQKVWTPVLPALGPAVLNELSAGIELELDYPREAATQGWVAKRYRDHPFIHVPEPVAELTTAHVLVTEFVDGAIGFDDIRKLPADTRNRIGEIMYRFYVGSLYRYHDFCGDPHPGNIKLRPDGRVSFLDFGLFNRMAAKHVNFELKCLRAASEERGQDLYDMMVRRGIIDAESGVTPDECLEYVLAASEWCLVDQDLEITPEIASGAFLLAIDGRSAEFTGMKHQTLPPEHLFSRRTDFYTFGVLGQLHARNNWHRIAREWIYGEDPVTELGKLEAEWRHR